LLRSPSQAVLPPLLSRHEAADAVFCHIASEGRRGPTFAVDDGKVVPSLVQRCGTQVFALLSRVPRCELEIRRRIPPIIPLVSVSSWKRSPAAHTVRLSYPHYFELHQMSFEFPLDYLSVYVPPALIPSSFSHFWSERQTPFLCRVPVIVHATALFPVLQLGSDRQVVPLFPLLI